MPADRTVPPPNTPAGTVHALRHGRRRVAFVWNGADWRDATAVKNIGLEIAPGWMTKWGWRYVGPAEEKR